MDNLDAKVKAERARYQREWRKANPDKVRAINQRYWERRAEKVAARQEQEATDENGNSGKARA